jgi:hypothetical protein
LPSCPCFHYITDISSAADSLTLALDVFLKRCSNHILSSMAVSVFKAALLSRFNFPSTEYFHRVNMNNLTLLAVFALGVMFTCFVSILTLYIQKEIGLHETERITEDLI